MSAIKTFNFCKNIFIVPISNDRYQDFIQFIGSVRMMGKQQNFFSSQRKCKWFSLAL